jgi:signal transduction histidine kinase
MPRSGAGAYAGPMDSSPAPWWWRRSPVRDAVYAVVMTVITVAGAYAEAHPRQVSDQIPAGTSAAHTPTAALLLVVLAGLVLIGRNQWPLAVYAVSVGAVTLYSALGYVNGAALLLPAVAVYTLATKVMPLRAIGWAALAIAGLMTATGLNNAFGPTGGDFWVIPGVVGVACLGGIAVASRRAYVTSIQARAEQEARRRIDDERLQIARDLHDVVAHTMATINVQASAAAQLLTDRPAAAAEALQTIRAASKDGLRELRAILNVLRRADEAEPTQPASGLAQLDPLIDRAGQAGLPATLTVTGPPRTLPAAVELAAYRIVQESLTNTIRHAGPATATVTLAYRDADLLIEVIDTGRGPALGGAREADPADRGTGTGHGLAGMRERAASAGGAIEAGPRAAGGFRVAARLPVPRPKPPAVVAEDSGDSGSHVADEAIGRSEDLTNAPFGSQEPGGAEVSGEAGVPEAGVPEAGVPEEVGETETGAREVAAGGPARAGES